MRLVFFLKFFLFWLFFFLYVQNWLSLSCYEGAHGVVPSSLFISGKMTPIFIDSFGSRSRPRSDQAQHMIQFGISRVVIDSEISPNIDGMESERNT